MKLKKDSNCSNACGDYFGEYCSNSSIHGLKFLGERRRSLVERFWWIAFLTISLYFCITSILQAYYKWEHSPVVVSFSTSETPVWKIPFPAITICPQTKTQRHLVNYTDLTMKKIRGEDFDNVTSEIFEYITMICKGEWNGLNKTGLSDIIDGEKMIEFFMKVQPVFYNVVDTCYWMGKDYSKDIYKLFTPIITHEGICYSFNMLDRDEMFTKEQSHDFYDRFSVLHKPATQWFMETGYQPDADLESYPYRSLMSGLHGGLDLTLSLNSSDIDYLCGDNLQGYKIILHNPVQFPYVKQRHFRVGLNEDILIAVKPNIMTTSKQLKEYKPSQRKCFFTNEKELKFFKSYDQKNCMQECLANFSYNHCGCVGFYMLRNESTPVCGLGMHDCIEEATSMFLANDIKYKMKYHKSNGKDNTKSYKNANKCNCLPSCDSLTFEAEVSQTDWSWKEAASVLSKKTRELSERAHFSRLQIFFKDMQFITSERNELYGTMDFLASCGGLLGLFIGFSFISLVEIFYYLSLKLYCDLAHSRNKNDDNQDDTL